MNNLLTFLLTILVIATGYGQGMNDSTFSYQEMPPAPTDYRPGNVLVRMIDGLGYRFYWATEGLRSKDLRYRPTPESRSTAETIDHILSLSTMILHVTDGSPDPAADSRVEATLWSAKRALALNNLLKTRQRLIDMDESQLAALRIAAGDGNESSELPYWNIINGPIADAIYHTGQIVSFRRISGNPMNPKVDVFRGKNLP